MRTIMGTTGCAMVAVLLAAGAATAGIGTDLNGMPGWHEEIRLAGPMPGFFEVLAIDVEYCVYAPGQFEISFPGLDPTDGTDYIYAYQIYNDLDPHPSAGTGEDPDYVSRFSVGLDTDELADNGSYLSGTGIAPDDVDVLTPASTQAGWNFTLGQMAYPSVSAILLFSSPYGPELDRTTVSGWQTASGWLPSPVPEPATLTLMAVGAAWLSQRKRRS